MIEFNTFSVVARCPRTAQLAMAVSSAVPAVGALCLYGRAGVGAISTQSWVNPYLATAALDLLATGNSARQSLDKVLQQDPENALRQIGIVDSTGLSASWTGEQCTSYAGHIEHNGWAVQGNMLADPGVIELMARAMHDSEAMELCERLMVTLEAGQRAGGDKRGKQSAAIKVYDKESYPWIDLRVDDHVEPIVELRRILSVARVQLLPFVEGMPKRGQPAGALPSSVAEMLQKPPHQRPGGERTGAGRSIAELTGVQLSPERLNVVFNEYKDVLREIEKLRTLDLAEIHPAVVFNPSNRTATES